MAEGVQRHPCHVSWDHVSQVWAGESGYPDFAQWATSRGS